MRRPRTAALAAVLALAVPAFASAWDTGRAKASGCDPLESVPFNASVDYATQVEPLFGANGCVGCHDSPDGAGSLDLSGQDFPVACGLIDVGAAADGALSRVAPGDARNSLLYQKVACEDVPGFLGRMPPSGAISLQHQALFYDWIRGGAVVPGGECSGILSTGFESQIRD